MIRIVIADDHTIMREGLKRILDGALDIEIVGEAINGFEVLGHVRQGGFDLLLLDLSMPGRSGVDLIRQIKLEAPKLPILILTMHEEEQYGVRVIRAGANGYLDDVPVEDVSRFETDFLDYLRRSHAGILQTIRESLALTEDTVTALKDAIEEFRKGFETSSGELLSAEDEQSEPLEDEEQETIARRVPKPEKES